MHGYSMNTYAFLFFSTLVGLQEDVCISSKLISVALATNKNQRGILSFLLNNVLTFFHLPIIGQRQLSMQLIIYLLT